MIHDDRFRVEYAASVLRIIQLNPTEFNANINYRVQDWSQIIISCIGLGNAIERQNDSIFDVKNIFIHDIQGSYPTNRLDLSVSLTARIGNDFESASTFKKIRCDVDLFQLVGFDRRWHIRLENCEHDDLTFSRDATLIALSTDSGAPLLLVEFLPKSPIVVPRQN